MTNHRLFQTERVCRWLFHTGIWWKWWEALKRGRKPVKKRRNCFLQAIFSLSHIVFKRLVLQTCKKKEIEDCLEKDLTYSHTMTPFDASVKQAFWKHFGKRKNCSWWAISPFSPVFSTCLDNFLPFSSNLKLSSENSFSLKESKTCRLVMG